MSPEASASGDISGRQKTTFFDERGYSPLSQRAVALFGRGEGARCKMRPSLSSERHFRIGRSKTEQDNKRRSGSTRTPRVVKKLRFLTKRLLAFIEEGCRPLWSRRGRCLGSALEYFQTGGARLKIIKIHSPSPEGELCEASLTSQTDFFDSLSECRSHAALCFVSQRRPLPGRSCPYQSFPEVLSHVK